MKFSQPLKPTIDNGCVKLWSYNDKITYPEASIAIIEVRDGSHGKTKSKSCDRVYYIIKGTGHFDINGTPEEVAQGEVVVIPKNTIYDFRPSPGGVLEMLLVNTPAYEPNDEVALE